MATIMAEYMGRVIPIEIPGGIKRGPTFEERYPDAPECREGDSWMNAKNHLKRYRPKEYAELEASGRLEEVLDARITAMFEEWNDLLDSGLHPHEASEIVDPKYIYLPAEPGVEG